MKFDLEDMRQFADRHRGKNIQSGPHWSTVIRFPVLFDEFEKLLKINGEQQYRLLSRAEAAEAKVAERDTRIAALEAEVAEFGDYVRAQGYATAVCYSADDAYRALVEYAERECGVK